MMTPSPVGSLLSQKVLLFSLLETRGLICRFDFNTSSFFFFFRFVIDHLFADLLAFIRAFPIPKRPDQSLS